MKIVVVQHCPQFGGSPISGLVSVRALLQAGHEVNAIFGSDGPFVERYRDAGCDVKVIHHINWLRRGSIYRHARRWSRQMASTKAFVEEFSKTRPGLVLNNTLVSYASARAARQVGIPCLWHIRELFEDVGGEMSPPPLLGKRWVRRSIDKLATGIVINSQAVARNILGPRLMSRAVVIPNAVPDALFAENGQTMGQAREQLGLPIGVPIVGVPGTLRPVKGHRFLLDAIPRIVSRVPECRFAITGEVSGEYGKQIARCVSAPELAERCILLGRVEEMASFYRAADVICVPSQSESFGRVVIEAFAGRRPVVASSVGGIKEIVTDGKDGALVPYGDTSALASGIVRLLTDMDVKEELARNAYDTASHLYRESAYSQRVVQVVMETSKSEI